MDFIINHSGFFFGILMIVLLAVIGYFADKNDKKNADNIKKNVDKVNQENDASTLFNELPSDSGSNVVANVSDVGHGVVPDFANPSLNVVDNSIEGTSFNDSVLSSSGVDEDSISDNLTNSVVGNTNNNVSNQGTVDLQVSNVGNMISFNSSDFESLDFSLEDLEKKNFDSLVKENNQKDDDNYFYSNMEEPKSDIVYSDSNVNDSSVDAVDNDVVSVEPLNNDINAVVSDGESDVDELVSEISSEDNIVSESISDTSNDAIPELENSNGDSNEVVSSNESSMVSDFNNEHLDSSEQFDSNHLFDGETQSNGQNEDQFSFSSNDGVQDIPELFESNSFKSESDDVSENSLDLSDDSTGEDIWKF